MIQNRKFKNAIQILEPLKDVTNEAKFLLGIAFLDSGESIERAKQEFKACLDFKPDAYIMLAICEKRSGNTNLSTQLVQDCIDKYPNYKDALLMKAQLLTEKCKYKSALEVYKECTMTPPVHAGMGDCYRSLKKYGEAIQDYTKGMKKGGLDAIVNQLRLKRAIAYSD